MHSLMSVSQPAELGVEQKSFRWSHSADGTREDTAFSWPVLGDENFSRPDSLPRQARLEALSTEPISSPF